MEEYKKRHRIKDDYLDAEIDKPYKKTRELVGQIQNLKKVPSGAGSSEKRISKAIQRDSWSALKYALRLAQKLERKNLVKQRRPSDWDDALNQFKDGMRGPAMTKHRGLGGRVPVSRRRGRIV